MHLQLLALEAGQNRQILVRILVAALNAFEGRGLNVAAVLAIGIYATLRAPEPGSATSITATGTPVVLRLDRNVERLAARVTPAK